MLLKKILPIFFLISASIVYPAAKEQSNPSAALTEEHAPSTSEQNPSSPANPAEEKHPSEMTLAPLPSSKEMTRSYETSFVRMLVILLGIIFLVFATFWILRKLGKGKFKIGGGHLINIIERRPLSPKSILYIVEVEKKKILISESQLEVRALSSFEEPPELSE